MIALLDNGQDLAECEAEIACPVGQLLTPLTCYVLRDHKRSWAIDNGAFSQFDAGGFNALLAREYEFRDSCLFVSAPDVVGSARRTLEVFSHWKPKLEGWRIALVCQDGQENLPLPWKEIDAVFIGGTTKFKCSDHAVQIIKAAKAIGKWVHVGRVNHPERFDHFEKLGVDSIDGTGIARFTHMRRAIAGRNDQHKLELQNDL